jgi:hypothetical protein
VFSTNEEYYFNGIIIVIFLLINQEPYKLLFCPPKATYKYSESYKNKIELNSNKITH